jgi:hypothetical protein
VNNSDSGNEDDQEKQEDTDEELHKVVVILSAHTVVDPRAVMIKSLNTFIANAAVS